MKTIGETGVKGVNSEEASSIGPWFLPSFRNENSLRDANSLGGRWLQRELFQPKFEHCIKSSGRKNLVSFKVLGMRLRGAEREILSGEKREGRERELGQREKQTEKLRKEATLHYTRQNRADNSGNVICLPGCSVKCVLENDFLKVYIVVFYASRWEKEYQRI